MGVLSSPFTVTVISFVVVTLSIVKFRNATAVNLYPVNPMEVMLRLKVVFAAEKEAVLFQ